MRILFAKFFSSLFGFFHDYFHFNIRGLGFALRLINKDGIIHINGMKMYLNSKIPLSYARLISGDWAEPETHIFLNNALNHLPKSIFFDVGANVGEMVISTSNHSNLDKILAFEPDPNCANVIRINNLINSNKNCDVHQIAISNKEGKMFLEGAGTPQANLISRKTHTNLSHLEIDVESIDNFLEKNSYNFSSIDNSFIMLVDVEGHEPNVLKGAKNFIEENFPLIVFEFNSTSKGFFNLEDIINILPKNYEIYRLNRDGYLDKELSNTWNCVAINTNNKSHEAIKNISK